MGKNLRFWDPTKSAIRYASDYNNDGSDTLGIQEALNDLPDDPWSYRHGKVVCDVSGEIAATIGLNEDYAQVHLEGQGEGPTTLKLADGSNVDMIKFESPAQYCLPSISNMRLDGNKANQAAGNGIVLMPRCKQMHLDNVGVYHIKGAGLQIGDQVSWMYDASIKQCFFEGCDGNGVEFRGIERLDWFGGYVYDNNIGILMQSHATRYPINLRIKGVSIEANNNQGVNISKCARTILEGCYIAMNNLNGAFIDQYAFLKLVNNMFAYNSRAGGANNIYCRGPAQIMSNDFYGADMGYHIYVADNGGTNNVMIHDNRIMENSVTNDIHLEDAVKLSEVSILNNINMKTARIHIFKDIWVGHSLNTTHKWRGQATGTGILPAYAGGPSFETVLFDIAATGAGTSTLDMNGQQPFGAQFNSYINGSCAISDVSEADLYFGFYKDANEYAYFHVTQGNVWVKSDDGSVHGPYSADTLINVGDAETFHMMVEMLRSETPRFKLNGAVVGTPTTGSAPSTGVGVDAYVHLANRNNSAIQGYLNPVEITSGRDLW